MGITRAALRRIAKQVAQDNSADNATGLKLLLTDPGDYNEAIRQAVAIFSRDKPNLRVFDYTVTATGFRFQLTGSSSILPTNQAAPSGATAALAGAGAGNVDDGDHTYRVSYIKDAAGEQETQAGAPTTTVTVADKTTDGQVNVQLPALPAGFAGWKVYRTAADDLDGDHLLVGTQLSGAGTTFVDNVADANLGAAALELSSQIDPDAWVPGQSSLSAIYWPYDDASQAQGTIDQNSYRTRQVPGGDWALEFLFDRPAANDVIRLEYTNPHVLDEQNSPSRTTILEGDTEAIILLSASVILELAAVKAAQNTGNTSLPSDVVDRRSQSDVFRSRSKELLAWYQQLVGKGTSENLKGASAFLDLDTQPVWRFGGLGGFISHPDRTH